MIGLMTPYKVSNYGTKLQAYAVQQVVSRYGETEIIDYEPALYDRMVHRFEYVRSKRYRDFAPASEIAGAVDSTLVEARNGAIAAFDAELRVSPHLSGSLSLRRHARVYDAVVCGSDQIWNPINLAWHAYMLEFVPQKTLKVAFSPSFGVSQVPNELRATYRRRLARMNYLSVRESSGLGILEKLGFGGATWTLDPTLVLGAHDWEGLAERPFSFNEPEEGYLFCYFLGTRRLGRDVAREIARRRGLTVVSLPHFKGYVPADEDFGDVCLYDVTVRGFVWLLMHATAVCTDSFHGSAFSLLFERELYCCPRHEDCDAAGTNDRLFSLLTSVGMGERLIRDLDDLAAPIDDVFDYEEASYFLAERRKETLAYLDGALGGLR